MKLAVYTVSLPEYDLAESVAVLKEMGYEGVEWRVDKTEGESPLKAMFANYPKEAQYAYRYWTDNHSTLNVDDIYNECQKVKSMCDEAGLTICNLATTLKDTASARCRRKRADYPLPPESSRRYRSSSGQQPVS